MPMGMHHLAHAMKPSAPSDDPVKEVELHVDMDCPGCERTVRKALARVPGIDEVDIDRENQKVKVKGLVCKEKVLNRVRRKRQAELLPPPESEQPPPTGPEPEPESEPIIFPRLPPEHIVQPIVYVYRQEPAYVPPDNYYQSTSRAVPGSNLDVFSDENANNCSIM